MALKSPKNQNDHRDYAQARAHTDFWYYCHLLSPDFYTPEKDHLKDLCLILQRFSFGKLVRQDGKQYKKLVIELPPRHGKTRTLILLCTWLIGHRPDTKILTAAYNDGFATDFSKYTRNIIAEARNDREHIVFADLFPDIRIKQGESAYHQWALENKYFTFKSTGIGGAVTGKGGNLLLIDDPIKNAAEAFNENHLNKIWQWYTGTWLSRKETGAVEIINHTPWSKKDIGGRLQDQYPEECYVYSTPAKDEKTGRMLCPEILTEEEYRDHEHMMEPTIFEANYRMKRVDIRGVLYGTDWKTYHDLPADRSGKTLCSPVWMVCDTADKGSDYLCAIWGREYRGNFFVIDVYYTKSSVEVTEPELTSRIIMNETEESIIEANGAGRVIGVHIDSALKKEYNYFKNVMSWPTTGENKIARILSNAKRVKELIIFPDNWEYRWADFYAAVVSFLKEGRNRNDDAPDALTMIVERFDENAGRRAPMKVRREMAARRRSGR